MAIAMVWICAIAGLSVWFQIKGWLGGAIG